MVMIGKVTLTLDMGIKVDGNDKRVKLSPFIEIEKCVTKVIIEVVYYFMKVYYVLIKEV